MTAVFALTPGDHPDTSPDCVANKNRAELLTPFWLTTKSAEFELATAPVGPPDTATVSALLEPTPLYRVEVLLPLFEVHHGEVELALSPHPFTSDGSWSGAGTAFATYKCRLDCTLLACWQEGCKDPWLLLSDLAPEASEACWYGLRAWIEQGFKIIKRGGWQWQQTRMKDPERAARLWLCVAVATLWLLAVGGEAEASVPEGTLLSLEEVSSPRRSRSATRLRLVRVFRQGWIRLLMALLRHEPLPKGRFLPEPWPHQQPVPIGQRATRGQLNAAA